MGKSIIGIDIGGSKIRAVLWNGKRAIKAREFKAPKNLTAFKKLLGGILKNYNAKQAGIGFPGKISGNKVIFCPNIKYLKNFDNSQLRRRSSPAFGGASKLRLDNDARCFARAEYKDRQRTLFLTLGTGVGRAVGKGGEVLKIKKFEYPERWEKEYQKLRDSKNNKKLSAFLTAKISVIIKEFKPEVIIIGGGVSTREGFLKLLRKEFKKHKFNIKLKKPKFGKNAAAIGAAMLLK